MPKKILSVLVALVASVPASAACDSVFSTSTNQYVATPSGGRTILHSALSRTRSWIEPFGSPFLPQALGLDAVDVLADGRILFSTETNGLAPHAGGLIALDAGSVYEFDPGSGTLSPAADWNPMGIDLGPIDGLDRLDDGRYAFSVGQVRQVQHADGTMMVYPENVYMVDAATGLVSMIFDGRAFGLPDLDAVHVYGDGRVGFSTTEDCFVMTARGGRTLDHESVYILGDGMLSTALDGPARSVFTTDAVDLGETDVWVSLDRETIRWGTFAVAPGFDLVRGNVLQLQATGGDFALAIDECLAADTATLQLVEQAVPQPGSGWFYLVRRQPVGWWETYGPGQVAPRAPIDALQLCQ